MLAPVLERIRKLLALSKSPNQHEAESAMAKAHALMKQHSIDAADVDEQTEEVKFDWHDYAKGKKNDWDHEFVSTLARVFHCEVAIPEGLDGTKIQRYVVIGKETNIAVFREMYKYAYKFIYDQRGRFFDKMWFGPRSGKAYLEQKKSFEYGIIQSMKDKLLQILAERERHTQQSKEDACYAMVVKTEREKNVDAMHARFKDVKDFEPEAPDQVAFDGYVHGLHAGQRANFNQNVLKD